MNYNHRSGDSDFTRRILLVFYMVLILMSYSLWFMFGLLEFQRDTSKQIRKYQSLRHMCLVGTTGSRGREHHSAGQSRDSCYQIRPSVLKHSKKGKRTATILAVHNVRKPQTIISIESANNYQWHQSIHSIVLLRTERLALGLILKTQVQYGLGVHIFQNRFW